MFPKCNFYLIINFSVPYFMHRLPDIIDIRPILMNEW